MLMEGLVVEVVLVAMMVVLVAALVEVLEVGSAEAMDSEAALLVKVVEVLEEVGLIAMMVDSAALEVTVPVVVVAVDAVVDQVFVNYVDFFFEL